MSAFISYPRTTKMSELSGLNRYNYQIIAMTQNEKTRPEIFPLHVHENQMNYLVLIAIITKT